MKTLEFKRNEIIYDKGARLENLYYILEGEIELTIEENKRDIKEGTFGEWCILNKYFPSPDKAVSKTDSKVIALEPHELKDFEKDPMLARKMIQYLTQRFMKIDEYAYQNLNSDDAKMTFRDLHPEYRLKGGDFLRHYKIMKLLYLYGKYEDALKELSEIKLKRWEHDLRYEVEVWNVILNYELDPIKGKEMFMELDPGTYSNRMSYQYLMLKMNNIPNKFLEMYAKYGLHVPARTLFIVEGDKGEDEAYLLLRGSAKVGRYSMNGRESFLSIVEEGEFFGESALLSTPLRTASVYMDVACDVLPVTVNFLNEILTYDFDFVMEMNKNMLGRILFINDVNKFKSTNRNEFIKNIMDKYVHKFMKAGVTITEFNNFRV